MNRIHQPRISQSRIVTIHKKKKKVLSESNNLLYNVDNVDNLDLTSNEFIDKEKLKKFLESDFKYDDSEFIKLKDDIEINISYIQNKLEDVSTLSIKNKEDITSILSMIGQLKKHILTYEKQTEDYKKITNERIEKLVKLFLMINSKVQTLNINNT